MSILVRYLLLWLTLLSLLAYVWPRLFPVSLDPFMWGKTTLPYAIALTMFAIGWILPRDEVKQVASRWPAVIGGTAVQYTAMPLLAYVFAHLLRLDTESMIGLLIVGCVPGAMASNVLTFNARGNTTYSISLTTVATVLSPLMVPLTLSAALTDMPHVRLEALKLSRDLMITVVLPVVVGHLIGRKFTRRETTTRHIGSAVANLTILWIIAVVVGIHRSQLADLTGDVVVALLAVNLCGYVAGYGGAYLMRLPDSMRRALTLEIGMQNAGLGAFLATQFFSNYPTAAIPPALYAFGCMFTGTLLAGAWSRRQCARVE